MIQMRKTRERQANEHTPEQDVPVEVADASAAVSEAAECCVADIDDVLADTDDALEPEEDKARREAAELWDQRDVLRAKYAHLNLGGCWC